MPFLAIRLFRFSRWSALPQEAANHGLSAQKRIAVSADKAYETEVGSINSLLMARSAFGRSLLTTQFNFLTISGALIGVVLAHGSQPDPTISECICVATIWITFALQNELLLNSLSMDVLRRYRQTIVDCRFKIDGTEPAEPVSQWFEFYRKEYQGASSLSPSFILNVVILIGATGTFWASSGRSFRGVHLLILALAVLGFLANLYAFARYLKLRLAQTN